jgi:lipopolysaccharide biosynthesis glycosyltransferase
LLKTNKGIVRHSEKAVLVELDNRFKHACKYAAKPFSDKNLVYFTLNHELNYVFLFMYCLRSLSKYECRNGFKYDILIICPPVMRKVIEELISDYGIKLTCENMYFLDVDVVDDGVEASMNKLKIYAWDGIKRYGKVLFLDVDIVLIKPINELFDIPTVPGVLHSSIHAKMGHLHNVPYHTVGKKYGKEELSVFESKGIYAFNAGQYLFDNSERMLRHFYNVSWFSRAWPGEYFFEQAFMNKYFNGNYISDVCAMEGSIKFVPVYLGDEALDSASKVTEKNAAIHFTGATCNAADKIQFIRKYFSRLINYV